jgi:hypothetical protein
MDSYVLSAILGIHQADGRTFVAVSGGERGSAATAVARGSLFADEDALQLPQLGGEVFNGDVPIPPVSCGFKKTPV